MGWFDDSDEEDDTKQSSKKKHPRDLFHLSESLHTASETKEDEDNDSVDPLDAYMSGIHAQQANESLPDQETELLSSKNPTRSRLDLDNEDDEADEDWNANTKRTSEGIRTSESQDRTVSNSLGKIFHKAGQGPHHATKRKDSWQDVARPDNIPTIPIEKQFWTPTFTDQGQDWRKIHAVQRSMGSYQHYNQLTPLPDPIYHWNELRDVFGRPLLDKVSDLFQQPTPVQSQTLPVALSGKDAVITSSTGSGKTLAYLWPVLVHIANQPPLVRSVNRHNKSENEDTGPIGLVLVPTRELAIQVHKQAARMLPHILPKAHSKAVIGGHGRYVLLQELKRCGGVELVIATPGRFLDVLSESKGLRLNRITFCVLDEADKMLQMGFEQQVRKILEGIRRDRQTLLLSATMGRKVEQAAKEWLLPDAVRISVGRTGQSSQHVQQHVMVLPNDSAKREFLMEMLPSFADVGRTLVFVATRDGCEDIAGLIRERSPTICVDTLHGDKHQSSRNAALKAFSRGELKVLIATDVASRGLDVPSVATVVNFDAAKNLDSHVHRCGRAGRLSKDSQKTGAAYTLLTRKDADFAHVLKDAFVREDRDVGEDLIELASLSRRSGNVTTRDRHNKSGLGHERVSPNVAPPPKRSRWG